MSEKDIVEIKYRLADGEIKEIKVSQAIAEVFVEDKRRKKRHAMRKYRHGHNADLEKVLRIRATVRLDETPDSIDETVEEGEFQALIMAAIDALTPTQKRRVMLRYFMEMKLEDIARIENVSIQSISESLESALKRMKSRLGENI